MSDVQLIKYDTREAWLAARQSSLGASETAALFDLAPDSRESPYSLWAKKAGLVPPDDLDAEWLWWGHAFEPLIAERYAYRTGATLWTPPTEFCVAVHPRLPFLTATIDRWIIEAPGRGDRGDLEIKNVGSFNIDWKGDGGTEVPLHVQAQVQHQLAVTGFSWANVAALVGGNRMEIFAVERNEEFIGELEEVASAFWARIQRKDPPPIDGREATSRVLKRLHPDDTGETVKLGDDALEWVQTKETFDAIAANAKKKVEEAKNNLRAAIGSNTFGELPDGRVVSYKTVEKDGYVVKASKYRDLWVLKAKKACLSGSHTP